MSILTQLEAPPNDKVYILAVLRQVANESTEELLHGLKSRTKFK